MQEGDGRGLALCSTNKYQELIICYLLCQGLLCHQGKSLQVPRCQPTDKRRRIHQAGNQHRKP